MRRSSLLTDVTTDLPRIPAFLLSRGAEKDGALPLPLTIRRAPSLPFEDAWRREMSGREPPRPLRSHGLFTVTQCHGKVDQCGYKHNPSRAVIDAKHNDLLLPLRGHDLTRP